jgi:anaerobic selenocysteine-containing dehydrogenase
LIGGSLQDPRVLEGKDFVVVQEMFETETTAYADVILPAASFAEMDGTYTNNTGFVQRVRKAIEPQHQSKPDWMITSLIAKEFGVDFAYNYSATAVFKAIADGVPAYAGLRYPDLKDESRPVQVKHEVVQNPNVQATLESLKNSVATSPSGGKDTGTPYIGHKLHRLTVMTSKTPQFHLLAHGNPKPANLLVAPLEQFKINGSVEPIVEMESAEVGVLDRE